MRVRLSTAIMAHPSRVEYARRLRREIGGAARVILDPDPDGERNPWRCAREAWRATPDDCTHRLVVQEDILPCPRFLFHARRALAAKPDRIVSFYLGTNAILTWRSMLIADARGANWVEGSRAGWVPALALAVPQRLVASLATFEDGTRPVADDDVYGRWIQTNRLPWYATIPSLVDHDDDAPSLMRNPYSSGRRVAACPIGLTDPGLIDWTRD
jgi:hypothetical protein